MNTKYVWWFVLQINSFDFNISLEPIKHETKRKKYVHRKDPIYNSELNKRKTQPQ